MIGISDSSSHIRWDSGPARTMAGTRSLIADGLRGTRARPSRDVRSVDPRSERPDCADVATDRVGRRLPRPAGSSDRGADGDTNPSGDAAAKSSARQSATGVDDAAYGSARPGSDRVEPRCGERMGSETPPFHRQKLSSLAGGRPFFEGRPHLLDPVPHGLFVALAGLSFGSLYREPQRLH